MEFEKGKSYSLKNIEENEVIFCKNTTSVMFYRKSKMLFVFDKIPNDKLEYKLLTIMQD